MYIIKSDFIWGVAGRQVAKWLMRGQRSSLTDRADTIFEIVWRGVASDHRLQGEI